MIKKEGSRTIEREFLSHDPESRLFGHLEMCSDREGSVELSIYDGSENVTFCFYGSPDESSLPFAYRQLEEMDKLIEFAKKYSSAVQASIDKTLAGLKKKK